jgi:hypothetical protein
VARELLQYLESVEAVIDPRYRNLTCYNCGEPAAYFGSAGSGLGIFHIDLPKVQTTRWLNISNCGVVVIKKGEVSLAELEQKLSEIFCKKWP